MQFGRALVGAVVGGACGIAAYVGAYFLLGWQHTWFAVVVALLVGLGVRALVATKGHPSYVRGGLTALVAIAAFVGGMLLVVELAKLQAKKASQAARPVAAQSEDAGSTASESTQSAEPAEVSPQMIERPQAVDGAVGNVRARNELSTWDFIWMSVAALIAYELGRGSATAAPSATAGENAPTTPPPA
jgi:hypothetical protein